MLYKILIIFITYLFGAIPSGYLIAKLKYNKDLEIVNGKMGTKYVFKNLHFKASLYTFIMDFLKGLIPLWIIMQLFSNSYYLQSLIIISIIIGHNYSIFLNFKGGKGIASSLGCFSLYPTMLPIMLVTHYLANELSKINTIYSLIPLLILSFTAYDPYSYFNAIPFQIRFSSIIIIILFIIKTFDDPFFINIRNNNSENLEY